MHITQHSTSLATALQCPHCGRLYNIGDVQSYATCCNQPLFTRYRLDQPLHQTLDINYHTIWRYSRLLPIFEEHNIVSLGEGGTPLYTLSALSQQHEVNILLKDESVNPTGSFKARGISVAVSKAKELGIQHCIIPTAGNAGGALSAYCAKAGMKATVIMPRHTPLTLQTECRMYGAELILVDGLISDCGRRAQQLVAQTGGFDMSTLKEPYRLEGKKTIGYEIAEQLHWQLPDVIIYPTGGGTGLIGMWKAFAEMKQLGWLTGKLPRMVIVQSANCDPMVQLFQQGVIPADFCATPSIAYGLAVPAPFARDLMIDVLQQSKGTALTVTETEITAGMRHIATTEGLLLSPEGSATYIGMQHLIADGWIQEGENVLLFNTGSWYKYRS
ncbi:threonine synthase [Chitinophaga sancti]|uniref:Threonine synthase n=1 Tax=Chitinophaga sancti TaxID=1004 RepID=A0A1K1S621_9BACT|nr:threonine synthase [Chitinophaga sancti]WQD62213.1 threonine synthase [Chitinophaga sancti]WQG92218.1 threonine synthase [Chitinophaga sancti]SFW79880.1 threonine synthase [Chitinophaga sancti]